MKLPFRTSPAPAETAAGTVEERIAFLERRTTSYVADVAAAERNAQAWKSLTALLAVALLACVAYHEYRMDHLRDPFAVFVDAQGATTVKPASALLFRLASDCVRPLLAVNSATVRADVHAARACMAPEMADEFDAMLRDYAAKNGRAYTDDIESQAVATEYRNLQGEAASEDVVIDGETYWPVTVWGERIVRQEGHGKVDDTLFCYRLYLVANPVSPTNPFGALVRGITAVPELPDGRKATNSLAFGDAGLDVPQPTEGGAK